MVSFAQTTWPFTCSLQSSIPLSSHGFLTWQEKTQAPRPALGKSIDPLGFPDSQKENNMSGNGNAYF